MTEDIPERIVKDIRDTIPPEYPDPEPFQDESHRFLEVLHRPDAALYYHEKDQVKTKFEHKLPSVQFEGFKLTYLSNAGRRDHLRKMNLRFIYSNENNQVVEYDRSVIWNPHFYMRCGQNGFFFHSTFHKHFSDACPCGNERITIQWDQHGDRKSSQIDDADTLLDRWEWSDDQKRMILRHL